MLIMGIKLPNKSKIIFLNVEIEGTMRRGIKEKKHYNISKLYITAQKNLLSEIPSEDERFYFFLQQL